MNTPQQTLAEVLLDEHYRVWIVLECPFCGRRMRHQHGAGGPDDDPDDYLGSRVADCGGIAASYTLVRVDAEPQFERDHALEAEAARQSGLTKRDWNREYAGRTEPLTAQELAARGQSLPVASGW